MYNHSTPAIVAKHGPRSDAAYETPQHPMPLSYICCEVSFCKVAIYTFVLGFSCQSHLCTVSAIQKHREYPIPTCIYPPSPVPTGPPQALAVASCNATSITLTWRDPAPDKVNDRDGVTAFVVRRDGQHVANVTDKTYNFTGLQPATNYTFEVFAVNDQGRARSNHAAKVSASTTLSTTITPSTKTPSSTPSTPQGQCSMYCIKLICTVCMYVCTYI